MENETYKGYTIKIDQDDIDESPREWGTLGKMVCFHNRYTLGDKNDFDKDDFQSWGELEKAIRKTEDTRVIAPLYLYDHSGLRIKIGNFYGLLPQGHAEFDSGQVGFIYVTNEAIRKEYNVKKVTKNMIEKALKVLENEVKLYDQYISGDIYRFFIEDADGVEVDSCGGNYGYTETLEEAKRIVDGEVENRRLEKEKKLKGYIKNEVPLIYRTA